LFSEWFDCLRHATRPNLFSDLSSNSDNSDSSGSDSNCVFMYANSGTYPKGEICQVIYLYNPSSSNFVGKVLPLTYSGDFEMEKFAEKSSTRILFV